MAHRLSTKQKTSTAQNVMVGVALVSSIGAFATGFAAFPSRNASDQPKAVGVGQQPQAVSQQAGNANQKGNETVKEVSPFDGLVPGTKYYYSQMLNEKADESEALLYYSKSKKLYLFSSANADNTWGGSIAVIPKTQFTLLLPLVEKKLIGSKPRADVIYVKRSEIGNLTSNGHKYAKIQVFYVWDGENLVGLKTDPHPLDGVYYDFCEGGTGWGFCANYYKMGGAEFFDTHQYNYRIVAAYVPSKEIRAQRNIPTLKLPYLTILEPGEMGPDTLTLNGVVSNIPFEFKDVEDYISKLENNPAIQ